MTQMHSFQTMTSFTQECCSTCLVMTHFAKRNLISLIFPFSCQEIKTLKKKIRKRVFAMKKSIIKVALRSITSWIKLRFSPGNDPRFKITTVWGPRANDNFSGKVAYKNCMDKEQLLLKQLYFHGKEWSFTQIKKHILSFSPSDTDFLYDILKKVKRMY